MENINLPLSGAVNQWFRNTFQMFCTTFNIVIGKTNSPEVETRILDSIGSYGRQIGKICDVIQILLKCVDGVKLQKCSEAEKNVIKEFEVMVFQINKLKADVRDKIV
jgi:hypothetical protein